MDILYITSRADIGGGSIQLNQLIENLDENYNIYLACPFEGEMFNKWNNNKKILKIFKIPFRGFSLTSFMYITIFFFFNSNLIIHSHGKGAGIYSRLIKLFLWKVRIIHTFHGISNILYSHTFIEKIRNIYIEKFLSFFTTKYIAVSNGERELAINNIKLKRSRIIKIYNGINEPKVNLMSNKSGIEIVTISRFSPEKNMEFVFNVAKSLKNMDFLWIGDGETKEELSKKIDLNNIKNIKNIGFDTEPFNLISFSKPIYFSASKGEGLPLTLIEAMSLGIPIVASNVIGNNEVVIDSYNGFLFEQDNIEEALYKIQKIVDNPKLYDKFKINSLLMFDEKFQLREMISLTKNIYLNE